MYANGRWARPKRTPDAATHVIFNNCIPQRLKQKGLSPLALVSFVLSFYGESSGGNGLIRNSFVYDCITSTIG